ncbi:hypothetical protein LzC2_08490 [Planctomycetes bacterium LzC2]|uniref:Uncharacterized protein n=2 Tax=Alienimonas chondri TaxID=2681879 RepID=A0ABX1V9M1_9PLAN|nr:hypothetical protein [Alienimonas chondri]
MARLGVDANSDYFTDQSWEHTHPYTEDRHAHLPAYLVLLADGELSDEGKRALGSFVFHSLEDAYRFIAPTDETWQFAQGTIRLTLLTLWRDRSIHGWEFLYWACWDRQIEELHEDPDEWFMLTRVLRLEQQFDLSTLITEP